MQSKQENNMKDYNDFLDCPQAQANAKESTSNNTNTLTKKNEGKFEIKEEKSNPNILLFNNTEENDENENYLEDGTYFCDHVEMYEKFFQREGNEDERLTELYDVFDNTQKNPEKSE